MSNSMLVAVRAAARADVTELDQGDPDTGRSTSQQGSNSMSENSGKPGAETKPGISQADHDTAVATARSEGATAANERMAAILGANGIKGDGGRMAAAFDLAVKSPNMSAEDVAGFVTGNVSASASPDPAAAYEASRLGAAAVVPSATGQAQPERGKPKAGASINRSAIFAARRPSHKGA